MNREPILTITRRLVAGDRFDLEPRRYHSKEPRP